MISTSPCIQICFFNEGALLYVGMTWLSLLLLFYFLTQAYNKRTPKYYINIMYAIGARSPLLWSCVTKRYGKAISFLLDGVGGSNPRRGWIGFCLLSSFLLLSIRYIRYLIEFWCILFTSIFISFVGICKYSYSWIGCLWMAPLTLAMMVMRGLTSHLCP